MILDKVGNSGKPYQLNSNIWSVKGPLYVLQTHLDITQAAMLSLLILNGTLKYPQNIYMSVAKG